MLPGELRNRIYGFLLTDTRGPEVFADPVILINDYNRRKERRAKLGAPAMSTGLSKKSIALAKKHYMLNDLPINIVRLTKHVCGLPPLLETAVLRVSRQLHWEGTAILFRENIFALIVPVSRRYDNIVSWFPAGLDLSRIQHVRLEVQLYSSSQDGASTLQTATAVPWAFLSRMNDLKTLTVIITSNDIAIAPMSKIILERFWHITPYFYTLMLELVAAVPRGVEIKTGLTKVEKVESDYGGFSPLRRAVLRKIFKTYAGVQGAHAGMRVMGKLTKTHLRDYPVDGEGADSDED